MKTVKEWPITLRVTEDDGRTEAELVLETDRWTFDGAGQARKNTRDPNVAHIGDELAVGRALIALGNRLVFMAELDVEGREARSGPGTA